MSSPRNVSCLPPVIGASHLGGHHKQKAPALSPGLKQARQARKPVKERSGDLQGACRRAAGALVGHNLVDDLLSLGEVAKPRALDGADMDEYVLAAVVGLDEAKALRCVEPFDGSSSHRCSPVDEVERSGLMSPVRYRCGRLPRRASQNAKSSGRSNIDASP